MTGLALRSLRHRPTAFGATFLAVFLGAALIGAFATLLETSTSEDVSAADAETLAVMGGVVGGWGSLIVLFSVASTLAITVRERVEEIGLLRTVGATPRQARRLLRAEVAAVAGPAAVLGSLVAWPAGAVLLALLRDGGLVGTSVAYGGGFLASAATVVAVLGTGLLAAEVVGRRSTRGPATLALAEGRAAAARMPWWRVAIGLVFLAYGGAMAVVTVTVSVDDPDPYAAMATSGSNALLVGVGLAVLSPALLRWAARLVAPVVGGTGASGWLAAYNSARRASLFAGVLGPVIVLTAGAVGLLMLVGIDHRSLGAPVPEADTINLLNNLVTGMIVLFAALMVVNALVALTASRRSELIRLRLVGATSAQVRRSVLGEAGILAVVGGVLGAAASLATIVPFSVARDEGVVPDGQLWLPPLLVAAAVLLTVGAAGYAVRRVGAGAVPAEAMR